MLGSIVLYLKIGTQHQATHTLIRIEEGYNMAGYFPQAKRNYLLGVTLGF